MNRPSEATHLISADMLSKIYWSKLGLLGFFEMMPNIVMRRPRILSYPSASEDRAVIITRMTPNERSTLSFLLNVTKIDAERTFHQVVILSELLGCAALLDLAQQRVD